MSIQWRGCSHCEREFRQSSMKIRDVNTSEEFLCRSCFSVSKLQEIYDEHVNEAANYEIQIRTLLEEAQGTRSTAVAEVVGCSLSYARRFRYDADLEEALEKEWSQDSQAEKVSPGMRSRIIRRDGGACLRCEAEDDLEIHHIIPVNEGGEKEDENLAALCESCHKKAHGGEYTTGGTIYATRKEFLDWLNCTDKEEDPALDYYSTTQSTLFDF